MSATIHASAVLIGRHAVLIQGPSGSGKSRLALGLLQAAEAGTLRFARLVGDDRCHLEAISGRLLVRPAAALAGLIEVRGLGLLHMPHEPVAVVGCVVDLGATEAERLPSKAGRQREVAGILLPRLAVAAGTDPLPVVLALARSGSADPGLGL
jgi:serine kinase of HPr protein (carbohydrate metabolism regulator)